MSIRIVKEWVSKDKRYVMLTAENALNTPILIFPAEKKLASTEIGALTEEERMCPFYPNVTVRKDGHCQRSGICKKYKARCNAK